MCFAAVMCQKINSVKEEKESAVTQLHKPALQTNTASVVSLALMKHKESGQVGEVVTLIKPVQPVTVCIPLLLQFHKLLQLQSLEGSVHKTSESAAKDKLDVKPTNTEPASMMSTLVFLVSGHPGEAAVLTKHAQGATV